MLTRTTPLISKQLIP